MVDRRYPMHSLQILDMALIFGEMSDALMPQFSGGAQGGHASNTALLSMAMAKAMGIAPKQQGDLIVAALIHDIGMAHTPMSVLLKVAPLTKLEWEIIHTHPQHTSTCFKTCPGLNTVVTWASDHHERINGTGYPFRRKATDILVGGRILALADTFCAMTALRPYRASAYNPSEALELIQKSRSRLYDSKLVTILTNLCQQRQHTLLKVNNVHQKPTSNVTTKPKPLLYNQIHLPTQAPSESALNLSSLSMT